MPSYASRQPMPSLSLAARSDCALATAKLCNSRRAAFAIISSFVDAARANPPVSTNIVAVVNRMSRIALPIVAAVTGGPLGRVRATPAAILPIQLIFSPALSLRRSAVWAKAETAQNTQEQRQLTHRTRLL